MTNSSASDANLTDVLTVVRSQAAEIAALDSPRAEAWASDVLAFAVESVQSEDPTATLVDALTAVPDDLSATALHALGSLVPTGGPAVWSGDRPLWADSIGTSVCEGAWLLQGRGAVSVAFRFVDNADVRHVVTVDLVPGVCEQLGEVVVGPGDLLDALDEEDAGIESIDATPVQLAGRVAAALRATERPRESAVVNGRLLIARLVLLGCDGIDAPVAITDEIPAVPERDPEDDAYAVDLLVRALRLDESEDSSSGLDDVVAAVAEVVAPPDLASFSPAERDAVLALEWADWLGAVIGVVRAGAGTPVDGAALVDFVNRCPEVASTIPKADRTRIAWAFDTLLEVLAETGVVADGCLTDIGATALPIGLRRAWTATG